MSASPVTDELARLEAAIRRHDRLLTAYSGGIDSTVVAAVAHRVLGPGRAIAVIGDSPSLPRRELADAEAVAAAAGFELRRVEPNEQADAGYRANAGDRCYFCKTHLYATLHRAAADWQFDTLANGTNADDPGDHRPGLRAADEAAVVSPLLEARLGKAAVRRVAAELGLPNRDKPAAACLASRIPYGTPVTPELLARVEAAEAGLADLGYTGFRVRHHGDVARLELPAAAFTGLADPDRRRAVVDAVRAAGYTYVALDLEGFRSGSGNATLTVSAT